MHFQSDRPGVSRGREVGCRALVPTLVLVGGVGNHQGTTVRDLDSESKEEDICVRESCSKPLLEYHIYSFDVRVVVFLVLKLARSQQN